MTKRKVCNFVACQDCCAIFLEDHITPIEEVKGLLSRVAPGEEMPAGECPECGALCHYVDKDDYLDDEQQLKLRGK